jgi:hypothetical protein
LRGSNAGKRGDNPELELEEGGALGEMRVAKNPQEALNILQFLKSKSDKFQ